VGQAFSSAIYAWQDVVIGLPMMEGLLVECQKCFLARRKEAKSVSDLTILPLVLKKLTKSLLKISPSVLQHTFIDKDRTEVRLKIKLGGGIIISRVVEFGDAGDFPKCGCGAFALDKIPCGCMLYAAQKAGRSFSSLIDDSHKGSTFKLQYSDLPSFKVPGNEELADLEPENSLQPPAAFATKAGRPSNKGIKGAIELAAKQTKK